jgi:hypothetical protein
MKSARRRSPDHERVFWSLAGYYLRPGFGDPRDPDRVRVLWPLFDERLAFPAEARGWQQFFIAWRRVAGGLGEPAQTHVRDLFDPYIAPAEAGLKKNKKLTPQAPSEMLELLSALERVPADRRAALGEWLALRSMLESARAAAGTGLSRVHLWAAIGRVGAREPAYASAHHVVPPLTVERWLERLMREKWVDLSTAAEAAARMARRTDDRARDVSDRVRREVAKRLEQSGAPAELLRVVREHVPRQERDQGAWLGDTLPVGLRLLEE